MIKGLNRIEIQIEYRVYEKKYTFIYFKKLFHKKPRNPKIQEASETKIIKV